MDFTIGRPSPVPATLFSVVVCSLENSSKICGRYSSLMPMPVSSQVKMSRAFRGSSESFSYIFTWTPCPSDVYFIALLMMFSIISWSFTLSQRIKVWYTSKSTEYCRFFFLTSSSNTVFTVWNNVFISSAFSCRAVVPLSIRAISRIWLIIVISRFPEEQIFPRYSFAFSSFWRFFSSNPEKPMIAFIGVRISWLILNRNRVFASLALFASSAAFSSSAAYCFSLCFLLDIW